MEYAFALSMLSFFGEVDRVACEPGWWLPSERVCAERYMECRRLMAKIDGEKGGTVRHLLSGERERLVQVAAWWERAGMVRNPQTPAWEKLLLLEGWR